MKFITPLIAVSNLDASKEFYQDVMGMKLTLDLGNNVSFDNGALAIQYDYAGLVGGIDVKTGSYSNDHELYFEDAEIDGFLARLDRFPDIRYVHSVKEYPWGQRVVRFYDPDGHIIEVGESMESVFRRFHAAGMTVEQVAERTMHPVEFVRQFI